MFKVLIPIFLIVVSSSAKSQDWNERQTEGSLNTANVINSAWELRRLSESLEPGIDTRCYIAKLAAFKAKSLPAAAEIVKRYESTDSDRFAVQSAEQAIEIFSQNRVQEIANECKSNKDS
ncbi:hypothetical protein [Arenicella xantha]|uniref:DUF4476 domain-containing protein n=1 Tax=Arenicella xantha TaxID=644221 RepID=A0A395JHL2_9GAMM|nr:hypothetical protein [Arenicella xantha]RBP49576.1 hypothetical protein DFR28_1031 [Arenicella xantha]